MQNYNVTGSLTWVRNMVSHNKGRTKAVFERGAKENI
jgi:hypothetical protein